MSERAASAAAHSAGLLRRMTARSPDEEHRASTPLELLFDLCYVVAVAQAGRRLVHDLVEGHPGPGIGGYLFVFWGIWWAWMNFSWFASAYDTDDVPYRLLVLLQIAGGQVFAAGVPRAFDADDWTVCVAGYVIMRIAQTTQWLRAARAETGPARTAALRYAAGLLLCQAGWVALLFAPDHRKRWYFVLLALCELAVPIIAERTNATSWHPRHIAERYGGFTLIVLGETVAAGTVAVQSGIDEHDALARLLTLAAGGLLIVFGAWWIYFAVPAHDFLRGWRTAIVWGYGHYVVFASAAAIGAGLEVSVEEAVGKAEISATAAAATVTVPTAVFLLTVWLLHSRRSKRDLAEQAVLPTAVVAVLSCTFAGGAGVLLAGTAVAAAVAVGVALSARRLR